MNLPKNYEASAYEDSIYQKWEQSGAFQPSKSQKPFTIMMPPPNATGELHLGHAIMLAVEDIMIRHKRMQGYSALWLPGTDHGGIATQTRVEKNLLAKNLKKEDLGRENFLKEVDSFVENSQATIRKQVKKMGSSCDWTRERFTLEPHLNSVVNKVFCDMYADGLIYKGHRIVNWDPLSQTAISDDEVEHKEVNAKLYYIKYGPLEIATSRPETKLGDTAVAVNPSDERYKHLVGQTIKVNFGDHQITVKVIADDSIDPNYGTGALGVTPAHSFIDYELAKKHDVEVVQVINAEGRMTEVAGKYQGMTVQEARDAFAAELDELGLLIKVEEYKQNLSISYRSGGPIEPLISEQWFVDVNKEVVDWQGEKLSLRQICQKVVRENQIEFIPERFSKTYFHWIDNLHDWCISRQLWYGHRIPAWYHSQTKELKVQAESPGQDWEQESDTLDTWFSSGLWTFSTLGWPEATDDFKKFHPTDVLETGYDIIPFWVARMILMTTYATKQIPFKTVYLHGLVRDRNGKKMSKTLGNGIDPLDMIAKYGTDALRLSLVIGNSPGNDLKIYEEKIESYRNFVTKLWNASRFTLSNIENPKYIEQLSKTDVVSLADKWIVTRLQEVIQKGTELLNEYKLSEAGLLFYDFLWDEFCDWYLEFSKETANQKVLNYVLQNTLIILHPFIPFVTEQIWESLNAPNLLIQQNWPASDKELIFDEADDLNLVIQTIKNIRTEKANFGVATSRDIEIVFVTNSQTQLINENTTLIEKLAKVKVLEVSTNLEQVIPQASLNIVTPELKFYMILTGKIDFAAEITKTQNEIENQTKVINSLKGRLSNKSYIENAPKEIVEETENNLKEGELKLIELNKRLTILQN
jgi:valyl-tRNA synthetase